MVGIRRLERWTAWIQAIWGLKLHRGAQSNGDVMVNATYTGQMVSFRETLRRLARKQAVR